MNKLESIFKNIFSEEVLDVLEKLTPGKSVRPEGKVDTSEDRRNSVKQMGAGTLAVTTLPGFIFKEIIKVLESFDNEETGSVRNNETLILTETEEIFDGDPSKILNHLRVLCRNLDNWFKEDYDLFKQLYDVRKYLVANTGTRERQKQAQASEKEWSKNRKETFNEKNIVNDFEEIRSGFSQLLDSIKVELGEDLNHLNKGTRSVKEMKAEQITLYTKIIKNTRKWSLKLDGLTDILKQWGGASFDKHYAGMEVAKKKINHRLLTTKSLLAQQKNRLQSGNVKKKDKGGLKSNNAKNEKLVAFYEEAVGNLEKDIEKLKDIEAALKTGHYQKDIDASIQETRKYFAKRVRDSVGILRILIPYTEQKKLGISRVQYR